MINLEKTLKGLGACSEYIDKYKGKSLKEAWNTCRNEGDMHWFICALHYKKVLTDQTYNLVNCAYEYGARIAKKYRNTYKVPQEMPYVLNACRSMRLVVSYRTILRAVNKL